MAPVMCGNANRSSRGGAPSPSVTKTVCCVTYDPHRLRGMRHVPHAFSPSPSSPGASGKFGCRAPRPQVPGTLLILWRCPSIEPNFLRPYFQPSVSLAAWMISRNSMLPLDVIRFPPPFVITYCSRNHSSYVPCSPINEPPTELCA